MAHCCADFPNFRAHLAQQSPMEASLWPISVPSFRKTSRKTAPHLSVREVLRYHPCGVGSVPHRRNTTPETPGVLRYHPRGVGSVPHRRNTTPQSPGVLRYHPHRALPEPHRRNTTPQSPGVLRHHPRGVGSVPHRRNTTPQTPRQPPAAERETRRVMPKMG